VCFEFLTESGEIGERKGVMDDESGDDGRDEFTSMVRRVLRRMI